MGKAVGKRGDDWLSFGDYSRTGICWHKHIIYFGVQKKCCLPQSGVLDV